MDGKLQTRRVTALCSLAYLASYITRLGVAAGLIDISASLGTAGNAAALACTGLFITYGAGQFVSGWLGDRFSPAKIIAFGLLGASCVNMALPFAKNGALIIVLWCGNGLCQAMLWPPMVRIMAESLDEAGYLKASRRVSVAANMGTMAVYALMSACTRFASWQWYFRFAAVFGAVISVFFLRGMRKVAPLSDHEKKITRVSSRSKAPVGKLLLESGLPMIMLAIVMQGMLRDGVTTWMPSLISETTSLASSTSILSVVALPIFSVLCIDLAAAIQKRLPNDALSSSLLFLVGAVCAGATLPLLGGNAIAVIFLTAALTGCMHAVNFLLICHIPSYFAGYGCVSAVSGIINSCTYIGSAISTYGIALLSAGAGWKATVGVWCAIAIAGGAFCLFAVKRLSRFANLPPIRQKAR